jgi:hypothetical protein
LVTRRDDHYQRRHTIRARVGECDATRKQRRISLLPVKDICGQLLEILHARMSTQLVEHCRNSGVPGLCVQILDKYCVLQVLDSCPTTHSVTSRAIFYNKSANVLSPKYVRVSPQIRWLFFKAVRAGLAVSTSVS